MIWRSKTSAECDYFNDRWLQFRGRSMEQEYGNQWAEGVHPGDFHRCLSTYLEAFGKREPFEMEYRLKRHDGEYRWILDKGAPFFTESNEFQGFIGSCIDVTDRIEAQRALDEARERELASLHGILPICMQCRRIRGAAGQWSELEHYIRDHSRADFSHGLCPECYEVYREHLGTKQRGEVPKDPRQRSRGTQKPSWRDLVARYAIRAREFAEAVAALGRDTRVEAVGSREVLGEIRARLEMCNEVAAEVERYFNQQSSAADSSS
jgi:PAS domain S-box-containing protein